MTRAELNAVAARAEKADAAETREVLVAAWNACQAGAVCPQRDFYLDIDVAVSEGGEQRWGEFRRKLDAEAYVDAALMLVPDIGEIDGKRLDLHCFEKIAIARCYSDMDTDHKARAATPALAIVAAACRALAEEIA